MGKGWALTPLPLSYTLQYYERVIVETPKYIVNSFLYSGLAVVVCIAVGVPDRVAPRAGRTVCRGAERSTRINTPDPGRSRHRDRHRATSARSTSTCPGFDRGLTSLLDHHAAGAGGAAAALHRARRRSPRCSLVHRSLEEAASSVGATSLRTFSDVTLPHDLEGRPGGRALFSFMTSLQEASAVLFLALGGWESHHRTASSPSTSRAAPTRPPRSASSSIIVAAVSVAIITPHGRRPWARSPGKGGVGLAFLHFRAGGLLTTGEKCRMQT